MRPADNSHGFGAQFNAEKMAGSVLNTGSRFQAKPVQRPTYNSQRPQAANTAPYTPVFTGSSPSHHVIDNNNLTSYSTAPFDDLSSLCYVFCCRYCAIGDIGFAVCSEYYIYTFIQYVK